MAASRRQSVVAATISLATTALVASSFASAGITGGSASTPVPGRPAPVSQKPSGTVSIAMIGISNNPYWNQVKVGFDRGAQVLKPLGAHVEWVDSGSNVTSDQIGQAMNGAIAHGAKAVAIFAPDDGICSYIRAATRAGVSVASFNADASCAQASGSLFFHGQNLYAAGQEAAKQMCVATKGLASRSKPGQVGIETQTFTLQALELRRKGFIAGLKANCPWVTPVNAGVQYQSSDSLLTTQVRTFIGSTKNLVGIYVTGGDPFVAGKAVADAGKKSSVKVVAFDLTPQNAAALRTGQMYALLGQDPFGQAYDTLMWLYNYQVNHTKPAGGYNLWTTTVVANAANMKTALAAQATGS